MAKQSSGDASGSLSARHDALFAVLDKVERKLFGDSLGDDRSVVESLIREYRAAKRGRKRVAPLFGCEDVARVTPNVVRKVAGKANGDGVLVFVSIAIRRVYFCANGYRTVRLGNKPESESPHSSSLEVLVGGGDEDSCGKDDGGVWLRMRPRDVARKMARYVAAAIESRCSDHEGGGGGLDPSIDGIVRDVLASNGRGPRELLDALEEAVIEFAAAGVE